MHLLGRKYRFLNFTYVWTSVFIRLLIQIIFVFYLWFINSPDFNLWHLIIISKLSLLGHTVDLWWTRYAFEKWGRIHSHCTTLKVYCVLQVAECVAFHSAHKIFQEMSDLCALGVLISDLDPSEKPFEKDAAELLLFWVYRWFSPMI